MAVAYVTQAELRARLQTEGGPLVLDVRRPIDYDVSFLKIKGAIRLSPGEAHAFGHKLAGEREIIVYGRYGEEDTAQQAVQTLRARGFERTYPLVGGFQDWLSAGFEMEPK